MSTEVFVNELKKRYEQCGPLDRAKALNEGRKLGLSNREMGKLIGKSETHLRELLSLLRPEAEEQAAIAEGAPYRSYLKRVQQRVRDKKKNAQVLKQLQAERAMKKGVEALRGWIQSCHLGEAYAEQALGDVRTKIMWAEQDGRLQDSDIVWQENPEEIFPRNRPADGQAKSADIDPIEVVVNSIGNSILELIPNSEVRLKVIDTALSQPRLLTESSAGITL